MVLSVFFVFDLFFTRKNKNENDSDISQNIFSRIYDEFMFIL